jgi:hypothetical protein
MTTAEAAVLPETGRTTDHKSKNFGTSVLPASYSQTTPANVRVQGLWAIYVPLWRGSGSPVCRKTMRAGRPCPLPNPQAGGSAIT